MAKYENIRALAKKQLQAVTESSDRWKAFLRTAAIAYNYIFPKLGLEIAESSGHFHEKIINTETMPPSFWNWFVIGFERSEGNDDKILNYTRIFEANKRKLLRMSEGKHVINAFRKTGI